MINAPSELYNCIIGRRSVAVFLLGTSCLGVLGCNKSPDSPPTPTASAPPPAVVSIDAVTREDIMPETNLVGTVTAIRKSIVGSPVEGLVTQVNFHEGDAVELVAEEGRMVGEPIAQLSTVTVAIEIAAAKADLSRLEHELAELRAGLRPEQIAQVKAEWEAAKAADEYAQARFRRVQRLNESKVISDEEFGAEQSAARAAKQNLIAAKANLELAEAGPRSEKIAQSVAKMDKQEQELARLDKQKNYHTIRAPFKGFVVRKLTEVGQWLTRGDPVAEVVELDPIDVVVHVPESLVTQLQLGDKVPLTFDALPRGSNSFQGIIRGIVPSADARARTFPVRIRLTNPVHQNHFLLREGMQARATLSGRPRSTILVPKDALVLGGSKPVVMVVGEDAGKKIAIRVEVDLGIAREDRIEVFGELEPGQHVIVGGNERVKAGQELKIISESSPSEIGSENPNSIQRPTGD